MAVTSNKIIFVNGGTLPVVRNGVTIQTGSDTTGTGTSLSPYKTIQKALNDLYTSYKLLTYHRVIFVTGQSVISGSSIVIPDFESNLSTYYPTSSSMMPYYPAEEALTIYGDMEYNTTSSLGSPTWTAETTGSSYMQQVTVTGLTGSNDMFRGYMLLGSGSWQGTWVGRSDAPSGGVSRLYCSTETELIGNLKLTQPIELRNLVTSTGEVIQAEKLRCSIGIVGFKINSMNGERSIGIRDLFGNLNVAMCNLNRGFAFRNINAAELYSCRVSSGVAPGSSADATYSTYNESGPPVMYDYCLFDSNSFLDTNTDKGMYGCYFRACNDVGHGGGTYLACGQFDISYCMFDEYTNQGSGHVINYNGGPPCNIDNVTIRPGTGGNGICAREWGGLRVKEVKGSVTGWGMNIGVQTSPYLGGSGTVRISTGTTITGTSGDFVLGATAYATGYSTLRALPSGARRLTDTTYFATIWENS